MRLFVYLYLIVFSLILSLLLVPLAKLAAIRFKILDHPGDRKIHTNPKPYLGGVAIYLSFLLTLGINILFLFIFKDTEIFKDFNFLFSQIPLLIKVSPKLVAIISGASILVVLGVIDDKKGAAFSAKWKLFGQIIAALIVVFAGVKISYLPFDWMDWIFSILWIVGITNAFNLLDNMDGLSGGVAIISAIIFLLVTVSQGQFFMALILSVFVGSTLGFLKYNYNPSSIFMGDAGSMFLGFILGTLTISASYVTPQSAGLLPALMPLVILSIPIFDTISVIIIRIKEKRPIYIGDKRHLSHRLVDMGFSQKNAVNLIYLLTFTIGLAAFLLPSASYTESIIIFTQTLIILIIVSILMFVGKRNSNNRS